MTPDSRDDSSVERPETQQLSAAVEQVLEGCPIRTVARTHGIPRSTLRSAVERRNNSRMPANPPRVSQPLASIEMQMLEITLRIEALEEWRMLKDSLDELPDDLFADLSQANSEPVREPSRAPDVPRAGQSEREPIQTSQTDRNER